VLDPAMDPPLTSCNLFVVLCEGTLLGISTMLA